MISFFDALSGAKIKMPAGKEAGIKCDYENDEDVEQYK